VRSIAFIALLAAASPASAQTDEAAARAHSEAGRAHASAQRFEEAYAEFEAGYALSARPAFLFNMAECMRQLGRTEEARRDYERYLDVDPRGALAEMARARLGELGPPPEPEPEVIAPPQELAIAVEPARVEPLRAAPIERAPEIWEDWPFWVVGAGAVLVIAAVITIVFVATAPASIDCRAGCSVIDWRDR
jgi:tetratricopeptide (TPR) repeat protein